MNVEAAEVRQSKHGGRQDQSIRHHHQRIQPQAAQGRSGVRRLEASWLEHIEP
jgi:hypothetical protein